MKSDKAAETEKNIGKREVAIDQLLSHIHEVITPSTSMVKSFVLGGDFNTNLDQLEFALTSAYVPRYYYSSDTIREILHVDYY